MRMRPQLHDTGYYQSDIKFCLFTVTAERNLEWEGPWLRAEGAIHLEGPSGLVPENFEHWNFGNAISCDLVIKF